MQKLKEQQQQQQQLVCVVHLRNLFHVRVFVAQQNSCLMCSVKQLLVPHEVCLLRFIEPFLSAMLTYVGMMCLGAGICGESLVLLRSVTGT